MLIFLPVLVEHSQLLPQILLRDFRVQRRGLHVLMSEVFLHGA